MLSFMNSFSRRAASLSLFSIEAIGVGNGMEASDEHRVSLSLYLDFLLCLLGDGSVVVFSFFFFADVVVVDEDAA